MPLFHRRGLRLALFFAALTLATHAPVLSGRIPLPLGIILAFPPWASRELPPQRARHAEMGDLVTQTYPWLVTARRSLDQGELPLWNPHVLLGAPLLGNSQSALLYPPHAPLLFLPLPLVWSLNHLLRPVLAGTFTALFAHALGLGSAAAIVAGTIYAFSGFLVAWSGWALADGVVWLPALFLAAHRLRRRASGRDVALTAGAFAMPVLAGHPEGAFLACGVGASYALFLGIADRRSGDPPRSIFVARFALAALLAIGLAAIQLAPTLAWIPRLKRDLFGHGSWGHAPLGSILAFVSRDTASNPSSVGVLIPEYAAHVGAVALVALPFALLSTQRRTVAYLFALLAVCLQIIYGIGPVFALSQALPVLGDIPLWRLLFAAGFCVAMLAGIAVSAVEELRAREPKRPQLTIAFVVAIMLAVGSVFFVAGSTAKSVPLLYGPIATAAFMAIALFLFSAPAAAMPRAARQGLLVVVVAFEVCSVAARHFPYHSPEIPLPRLYEALPIHDPEFRIASFDGTAPANHEMYFGSMAPHGYDFVTRRTWNVLAPFAASDPPGYFSAKRLRTAPRALFDAMSIRYLLVTTHNPSAEILSGMGDRFRLWKRDGPLVAYENPTALPRFRLVAAANARIVDDDAAALRAVLSPGFAPRAEVVLLRGSIEGQRGDPIISGASSPGVEIVSATANRIALRVAAAEPSILVVADAFDPGWRATVDGLAVPTFTADYAFRGIAVAPGEHDVVMRYLPAPFLWGAATTAVGLAICLWLACRREREPLRGVTPGDDPPRVG